MSEAAVSEHPTLLLVDDDEVWRTRLAKALEARGFQVTTAASAEEAEALTESPEYAVLDLRMPGKSGLQLLESLRAKDPNTRALMLTGYGSIPTAVQATKLGAISYLTKPVDADDVTRALLGEEAPAEAKVNVETPSLARAEWEHINRVLADCDNNISEAARRLGLHRRSLQRKLQKYPPSK